MGEDFHDYLALGGRDLGPPRLLIFTGRSGAGKSTYIHWLLETSLARHAQPASVADEIGTLGDWVRLLPRVAPGRWTLVASHLPPWAHRVLRYSGPQQVFDLDRRPEKIVTWMSRRGVSAEPESVTAFCQRFGANYTDADLLMERYPGLTLGQALHQFGRECSIEMTPTERR